MHLYRWMKGFLHYLSDFLALPEWLLSHSIILVLYSWVQPIDQWKMASAYEPHVHTCSLIKAFITTSFRAALQFPSSAYNSSCELSLPNLQQPHRGRDLHKLPKVAWQQWWGWSHEWWPRDVSTAQHKNKRQVRIHTDVLQKGIAAWHKAWWTRKNTGPIGQHTGIAAGYSSEVQYV